MNISTGRQLLKRRAAAHLRGAEHVAGDFQDFTSRAVGNAQGFDFDAFQAQVAKKRGPAAEGIVEN